MESQLEIIARVISKKNPIIVLNLPTPKLRYAPLRGSKAFERGMSCFDDIWPHLKLLASHQTKKRLISGRS
jgi:hypothetical protein